MATDEMTIVDIKDTAGSTLRLQEVDGRYYPTFPPHVIKNVPSLKLRSDDVFLLGYLKTGTHWVWEIIRMLLAGTTEVPNVEKDISMVEQIDQINLDSLDSPRVLNSHMLFEQLPSEVLTVKPKLVYTTRNPKDCCISLFHHHDRLQEYYKYDGQLENYMPLFLEGKVDYGSFFDHIENYSRAVATHPDLQFHVVNYEDMIENGREQIKDLAEFLGVPASTELVEEIHNLCTLDAMRERKGKFDLDSEGQSIMYRKGGVGHWKTRFSEAMNKEFDAVYEEKMKEVQTNFYWRFSLD